MLRRPKDTAVSWWKVNEFSPALPVQEDGRVKAGQGHWRACL